jgi:Fur family peroxide stress response transcriptional regulator
MTIFQVRLNQMVNRLKDLQYRVTPQRLAVLKVLATSEDHPNVERIYDEVRSHFPTTSLATVYKTVTLLKDIGEVKELGFGHDSSRYDGNKPYPHPHVICTQCQTITDPEIINLAELSEELAGKTGYKILDQRLDFFGICPRCQKGK